MGMDFVALLRYSRRPAVVRAINGLENRVEPISAEVRALWRESGFFGFDWNRAYWIVNDTPRSTGEGYGRQVKRPRSPDRTVALRTVDGFFLTFGRGVCCVYHLLRWQFFLLDPRWQDAMLRACDTIADLVQSDEGVVLSDFHPSYHAFFRGSGFDACLKAAPPEDAEVAEVKDMYQVVEPDGTWDSHGYWRFRQPDRLQPRPAPEAVQSQKLNTMSPTRAGLQ
jgi:hypothetical protein